MSEQLESPSPAEVVTTVANASVGFGILTMTLFPLSLGGLLLIAPVALLIAPLVLIALLAALLAAPFVLVIRLARALMARRPAAPEALAPCG